MAAADGVRRQRVFLRLMAVPLLLLVVLSRTGGAAGAELQRVEDEDERPDEWSRPGGMREWDGHMLWDDDVLVLNGRNFELGVRSAPHMLVEFYAPWCGHCQKFEPVYQKVASHLRLEGVPVVLAKVDSISNPVLTKERGIAGFPSLHWFSYGHERHWGGGRNNKTMVEWIKYHARKDAVLHVASTMEAEDYLQSINATEAVIGRFTDHNSVEAKAFLAAAAEDEVMNRTTNRTIAYVMITESRGLGLLKLGAKPGDQLESGTLQGPAIGPSIILRRNPEFGGGVVVYGRWYTPPNWHMLPPDRRYSLFDRDRIKSFVGTHRMPAVVPLSPRFWNLVLKSPVRNQTLLFSDPDTPGHEQRMHAFEQVAKTFFGRVLFLQINSNLTTVMQYFGMKAEQFPAVVVAKAGSEALDKGEMYMLDQKKDEQNLTTIASKAMDGDDCRAGTSCLGEQEAVSKISQVCPQPAAPPRRAVRAWLC
jgi:protein disulfide-isomerase A1